jgi:K+-transporting ATPase ATPase C chain
MNSKSAFAQPISVTTPDDAPVAQHAVWQPALRFSLAGLVLCGALYSGGVTLLNQLLFPAQSAGSLIHGTDGKVLGSVLGSVLVAQPFSAEHYFHGRPSAVNTDPMNTAGSNLAPSNPALRERVEADSARLSALYQVKAEALPLDLLASSGSGVDPHISPAAARLQVERVAKARGCAPATVAALVAQQTQAPQWGVLGEPRVAVLPLNLALDQACPQQGQ